MFCFSFNVVVLFILFVFFSLFKNFVAGENKYSGLRIHENKLFGRAHAENQQSVPTKFAPTRLESNCRHLLIDGFTS